MPKKSSEIQWSDYVGWRIFVDCPYCGQNIEEDVWQDPDTGGFKTEVECWDCEKMFIAKANKNLK
jgi:hypothetical protein